MDIENDPVDSFDLVVSPIKNGLPDGTIFSSCAIGKRMAAAHRFPFQ